MDFALSPRAEELRKRLEAFMDECVYPNEALYHQQIADSGDPHVHAPVLDELKLEARERGLWNLFLPHETEWTDGLSNLDYAPLAEMTGRSPLAPEALNCSAPDTGNMELLTMFGTEEQKERWLRPLLEGEIRSCFAMTEPAVASSDATNISLRIERDDDHYVAQRAQVVDQRSGPQALPGGDRDGQDRPRRAAPPAAVDGAGAHGHARARRIAAASRCSVTRTTKATVSWSSTTFACPSTTCSGRRAVASPWRRPGSARAASTTACVPSGSPSGRWS